ncbi:hypothetical protein V8E53_004092 [Lactarius tabidus]
MSYDLYEEDPRFLSPSSSSLRKSPPSKHTLSRNRSTASLRGGTSSLAHELAVALLPEPTAGSKLLAEEFGIEYDEGAEGIDGIGIDGMPMPPHEHSVPTFGIPSDLDPSMGLDSVASGSSTPGVTDDDDNLVLDPTFHSPAPRTPARSQPEIDAMALLSQNLESTEQFLAHLRRLDTTDGPAPLALEALAADIISRLNETARDREEQVRELLKCEREFQRIGAEVGGADALAGLDALVVDTPSSSSSPSSPPSASAPVLDPVAEEPSFSHEWEVDPDAHLLHHSDVDVDVDLDLDAELHGGSSSTDGSPLKDTFPVSPPPASGTAAPGSPAVAIPHLEHLRTHTASLVSSLTALSEHAQVNGAATTDAGRKIRALKNKLGGWRTDWDSAERSRARIERWEVEGARRVDGRAFVAEHLREFERVLFEANVKTQAIMAPA